MGASCGCSSRRWCIAGTMDIFLRTRGIGVRLDSSELSVVGSPFSVVSFLRLRSGDAGGEGSFVDDDEEAFAASEDGAVGVLNFGLMEELSALAADVAADEDEWLVEGNGTEVG